MVARPHKLGTEVLDVQMIAGAQLQRVTGDVMQRRQPVHQGGHRGQHDPRPQAGQLRQRQQALRNNVGMRRQGIVRQAFPIGEGQHTDFGAWGRVEPYFVLQSSDGAGISGNDQQRALPLGCGAGDCEATAAAVQPAPVQGLPGMCGEDRLKRRNPFFFVDRRELLQC